MNAKKISACAQPSIRIHRKNIGRTGWSRTCPSSAKPSTANSLSPWFARPSAECGEHVWVGHSCPTPLLLRLDLTLVLILILNPISRQRLFSSQKPCSGRLPAALTNSLAGQVPCGRKNRSITSCGRVKASKKAGVHPAKSNKARTGEYTRRLPVVVGGILIRVGRTLLSYAVVVSVDFCWCRTKVKGGGQECPSHTI